MSSRTDPLRNPRPLIVGALYVAAGAAFLIAAQGYSKGSALQMGPGYFPSLVAALLIIVGILNIGTSFRESGPEGLPRVAWRPLLVVAASVIVFSVLIATAGLVPAIAGLIAVSLFATGIPTLRETIALIVTVEVICLSIFHLLLGLQVPLVRL